MFRKYFPLLLFVISGCSSDNAQAPPTATHSAHFSCQNESSVAIYASVFSGNNQNIGFGIVIPNTTANVGFSYFDSNETLNVRYGIKGLDKKNVVEVKLSNEILNLKFREIIFIYQGNHTWNIHVLNDEKVVHSSNETGKPRT
jgi:hypothetical protein